MLASHDGYGRIRKKVESLIFISFDLHFEPSLSLDHLLLVKFQLLGCLALRIVDHFSLINSSFILLPLSLPLAPPSDSPTPPLRSHTLIDYTSRLMALHGGLS